jgi:hypothetical protein
MTETARALRRHLRWHNGLYLALGVMLVPTAVGLWIVSFWVLRFLFALGLSPWVAKPWEVAWYIAWGGMAALVISGFRFTRPLFDLADYRESGYFDSFLSGSGKGLRRKMVLPSLYSANPMGCAYLVSQCLFLAPVAVVEAVKAFRAPIRASAATVAAAAEILDDLTAKDQWVSAATYQDRAAGLILLDRLERIRSRVEDGVAQIRRPLPDVSN